MRSEVEQRVLDFVRQSRMASAGDRVGVAVSGGADSVAMLRLLDRRATRDSSRDWRKRGVSSL